MCHAKIGVRAKSKRRRRGSDNLQYVDIKDTFIQIKINCCRLFLPRDWTPLYFILRDESVAN